jgi:hypothetical protein
LSKLGFNEFVGIRASRFPYNYAIGIHIATYYAYPNFQDKIIKPPSNVSTKFIVSTTLLFSIDIGGDPITADDATTSSNSLIMLVRDECLKKYCLM